MRAAAAHSPACGPTITFLWVTCVRESPLSYRVADHRQDKAEIVDLFEQQGNAGFAQYYARVYEYALDGENPHWVLIDSGGAVVGHIGALPVEFTSDAPTTLRAAVMAHLLVHPAHRTLAPALGLMRHAIDALERAQYDLLYANPTTPSLGLLKLARFSALPPLRRLVLPVGGVRRTERLASAAYCAFFGIRGGRRLHPTTPIALIPPTARADLSIRPVRRAGQLDRRTPGGSANAIQLVGAHGEWALLHPEGRRLVLLAHGAASRGAARTFLRRVGSFARHSGYTRLEGLAMTGTVPESELLSAGFRAREEHPLVARALSPGGVAALAAVATWELGAIDVDGGAV